MKKLLNIIILLLISQVIVFGGQIDLGSATIVGILPSNNGGAGSINGMLKGDGSGHVSQAVQGTDYVIPGGNVATLTTARSIYGNNFDGSAALTQIISSVYGGTGNGFIKFSGPTTSEKIKTLRDASDTILELGGSYTPTGTWTNMTLITPTLGTPVSGNFSSGTFTWPTFNQNTTGSAATLTTARTINGVSFNGSANIVLPEVIVLACSDETTDLTTGTAKVTFRMPYAMTLTGVRASVNTAPTGSTLIVDINESGSTIMTTNKLSIDASEKTSTTAATAAGITDSSLADDAEITIDIDQVGATVAGTGLKVTLIGTR